MVDMSLLEQFFVIPVILFCFVIGFIIRNYTKIPNKNIPLILIVVGVIANIGVTKSIDFNVVLCGSFSGLASSGAYDLFAKTFGLKDKSLLKKDLENTDDESF